MTPKLSSQIESKLRGLRRAVASWLTLRGLSFLLATLVGLLALSFVVDWWFMLEKSQRVVLMIVAVGVLLYLAWRYILYPLAFHLEDDMLAVRVEERHGELHNSLISALQFARLKDLDKLGVSPQMVAAAIEQGNAEADKVDFSDVLDRKAHRRHALVALLMLLILGGATAGVLYNELLNIWFNRVILFGDERYPRNTNFDLAGLLNDKNELILPRGDDWDAAVKVTGVVPGTVYLDIDYSTISDQTQLMTKQTAGDSKEKTKPLKATEADAPKPDAPAGEANFSATVKNVIEPFRFRVRGGDNRTDWIKVVLVDRPVVESFDLVLEHPQYTSRLPETVWSLRPVSVSAQQNPTQNPDESPAKRESRTGSSSVYALKGSTIRFKAASNKLLKGAVLRNEKGIDSPLQLETVKVKGEDGKEHEVSQFAAEIGPEQIANGTYAITLVDMNGLESKRPTRFNVRIRPDREPQVRAQLVGISGMIVPEARIPIASNLRDDFGIVKAGIVYQWRGESEGDDKGEGRVEFTDVKFTEQQDVTEKGFNYTYPWEVEPLKLKVGMNLTFYIEATDNDTIDSPEGKTGKSAGFFVRVVTDQELREELLRREQEQRQEFERLIKNQDDLIAESRIALTANATETGGLSPALRSQLMQVQKRQKLIGDRCLAIAKQYDQIGMEVSNNKLEADDGPVQARLYGKVIGPLTTIGNQSVDKVTNQVEKARKAGSSADREQEIQELINLQNKLATELRDVLKYMVRWSNYQQAVNDLYAILETQGKVTRETMEAHKARLERGIFGEDNKPKNP